MNAQEPLPTSGKRRNNGRSRRSSIMSALQTTPLQHDVSVSEQSDKDLLAPGTKVIAQQSAEVAAAKQQEQMIATLSWDLTFNRRHLEAAFASYASAKAVPMLISATVAFFVFTSIIVALEATLLLQVDSSTNPTEWASAKTGCTSNDISIASMTLIGMRVGMVVLLLCYVLYLIWAREYVGNHPTPHWSLPSVTALVFAGATSLLVACSVKAELTCLPHGETPLGWLAVLYDFAFMAAILTSGLRWTHGTAMAGVHVVCQWLAFLLFVRPGTWDRPRVEAGALLTLAWTACAAAAYRRERLARLGFLGLMQIMRDTTLRQELLAKMLPEKIRQAMQYGPHPGQASTGPSMKRVHSGQAGVVRNARKSMVGQLVDNAAMALASPFAGRRGSGAGRWGTTASAAGALSARRAEASGPNVKALDITTPPSPTAAAGSPIGSVPSTDAAPVSGQAAAPAGQGPVSLSKDSSPSPTSTPTPTPLLVPVDPGAGGPASVSPALPAPGIRIGSPRPHMSSMGSVGSTGGTARDLPSRPTSVPRLPLRTGSVGQGTAGASGTSTQSGGGTPQHREGTPRTRTADTPPLVPTRAPHLRSISQQVVSLSRRLSSKTGQVEQEAATTLQSTVSHSAAAILPFLSTGDKAAAEELLDGEPVPIILRSHRVKALARKPSGAPSGLLAPVSPGSLDYSQGGETERGERGRSVSFRRREAGSQGAKDVAIPGSPKLAATAGKAASSAAAASTSAESAEGGPPPLPYRRPSTVKAINIDAGQSWVQHAGRRSGGGGAENTQDGGDYGVPILPDGAVIEGGGESPVSSSRRGGVSGALMAAASSKSNYAAESAAETTDTAINSFRWVKGGRTRAQSVSALGTGPAAASGTGGGWLGGIKSSFAVTRRRNSRRSSQNSQRSDDSEGIEVVADFSSNPAHYYRSASVLFVYLDQFTEVSGACHPLALTSFLNRLYRQLDEIVERHGCYKVMAIANMYLVVSGAPVTGEGHAVRLADCACAIMKLAISNPDLMTVKAVGDFGAVPVAAAGPKMSVTLQAGMHCGELAAGVIGQRTKNWHVYGDTVNTASRMCSTGQAGRIQVSPAMREMLRGDPTWSTSEMLLIERGEVYCKGKGMIFTSWLTDEDMEATAAAAAAAATWRSETSAGNSLQAPSQASSLSAQPASAAGRSMAAMRGLGKSMRKVGTGIGAAGTRLASMRNLFFNPGQPGAGKAEGLPPANDPRRPSLSISHAYQPPMERVQVGHRAHTHAHAEKQQGQQGHAVHAHHAGTHTSPSHATSEGSHRSFSSPAVSPLAHGQSEVQVSARPAPRDGQHSGRQAYASPRSGTPGGLHTGHSHGHGDAHAHAHGGRVGVVVVPDPSSGEHARTPAQGDTRTPPTGTYTPNAMRHGAQSSTPGGTASEGASGKALTSTLKKVASFVGLAPELVDSSPTLSPRRAHATAVDDDAAPGALHGVLTRMGALHELEHGPSPARAHWRLLRRVVPELTKTQSKVGFSAAVVLATEKSNAKSASSLAPSTSFQSQGEPVPEPAPHTPPSALAQALSFTPSSVAHTPAPASATAHLPALPMLDTASLMPPLLDNPATTAADGEHGGIIVVSPGGPTSPSVGTATATGIGKAGVGNGAATFSPLSRAALNSVGRDYFPARGGGEAHSARRASMDGGDKGAAMLASAGQGQAVAGKEEPALQIALADYYWLSLRFVQPELESKFMCMTQQDGLSAALSVMFSGLVATSFAFGIWAGYMPQSVQDWEGEGRAVMLVRAVMLIISSLSAFLIVCMLHTAQPYLRAGMALDRDGKEGGQWWTPEALLGGKVYQYAVQHKWACMPEWALRTWTLMSLEAPFQHTLVALNLLASVFSMHAVAYLDCGPSSPGTFFPGGTIEFLTTVLMLLPLHDLPVLYSLVVQVCAFVGHPLSARLGCYVQPWQPLLIRCIALLGATLSSIVLSRNRELARRYAFNVQQHAQKQQIRCAEMLSDMLPSARHVARLLAGEHVVESLPKVAMLYSDIVGFTDLSAKLSPQELIQLLHDLYSGFDACLAELGLYKVETIGDAFICVGGLDHGEGGEEGAGTKNETEHLRDAVRACVLMSQLMLAQVEALGRRTGHRELGIRVGVHLDSVVGGVVGSSRPRYFIWGAGTVMANAMESTGVAGRCQVSLAAAVYLAEEDERIVLSAGVPPLRLAPHQVVTVKEGKPTTRELSAADKVKLEAIVQLAATESPDVVMRLAAAATVRSAAMATAVAGGGKEEAVGHTAQGRRAGRASQPRISIGAPSGGGQVKSRFAGELGLDDGGLVTYVLEPILQDEFPCQP